MPARVTRPVYPFLSTWSTSRYDLGYLRRGLAERDVQEKVIQYLNLQGHFAFALDSGAKRLRGRAVRAMAAAGMAPGRAGALIKGMSGGSQAGIPDVFAVLKGEGRAALFEVKKPAHIIPANTRTGVKLKQPAGQPTDEQLAFLLTAHQAGAIVGVVWSVEDVAYILTAAAEAALEVM